MAKKKSQKKRSGKKNLNINRLVWALVALVVIVFALYRFFGTPRGSVFLLDNAGLFLPGKALNGHFESLQEELGRQVRWQLGSLGIREEEIRSSREKGERNNRPVVSLQIEISPEASLIQVNAAIDKAVSSVGASVRFCREKKNGRSFKMEIGTRREVTHRCYIAKSRKRKESAKTRFAGPVISIVVDDFGFFNNRLVRDFLGLKVPITVTVIPGLKHSAAICKLAGQAGKEVLCHLPMEPEKGADDVGDIPLVRVSMKKREIEKVVEMALRETPGAIGINNHMGSKATADRKVMDAVLGVCRRKKIFFFDSLTTSRSVVSESAKAAGVKSCENDLFLDNKKENTRENMEKLLSMAVRKGRVTAIMHVRKDSLKDLRWLIEESRRRGIRMVRLSEMLEGASLAANQGGRF